MSMFCYQCQETAKNQGCTLAGVCGKTSQVANLQDLLVYVLKGISIFSTRAREKGIIDEEVDNFIIKCLFSTLTNVNFAAEYFVNKIFKGIDLRERLKNRLDEILSGELPEMATWLPENEEEIYQKASEISILDTKDEDIRSLREILIYGLKGIAAYADHAFILDKKNEEIPAFIQEVLAATTDDSLSVDELIELVMRCGEVGARTMALLDEANTTAFGNPEPTKIKLSVRDNPGILVSGHDLKDLMELLEQTRGTGVDVYTHGEMLPAHAYPAFKEYEHFVGHYGNAWWNQAEEFDKFKGPILMTTNCLVPPKEIYKDRLYTTGVVGFDGVKHIPDRKEGQAKDFSAIIEQAKKCAPPEPLEDGEVISGFAHNAVLSVADKVVEAVKTGKIKRFFVVGGCDGRHRSREYYTRFVQALPEDTVILTAGCGKFRFNKLELGEIDGIPRILDAGQCNDAYSLVVVAQKLVEAFKLDNINQLPISYNISWYEQKAVLVLLVLLYLGVKNIRLGPTLPAFISKNVLDFLVKNFNIHPISSVEEDLEKMINE